MDAGTALIAAPRGRAAGDFGVQCIEPLAERAQWIPQAAQLGLGRVETAGIEGVHAPRPLCAYLSEPVLAQHPQMLRHGRLRDAELDARDVGQRARWLLADGEHRQQPPTHGIPQNLELVHELIV